MDTPLSPETRWVTEEQDEFKIREFSCKIGVPYLPALILWNRGYRDSESVERFLNPKPEHLHKPLMLPDIHKAVERLLRARENGEAILIHGDYDVDGVTGTALLMRGLTRIGINADSYLPHRLREGYGLSARAIDEAVRRKISIILTVDCGITAFEEAASAKKAGVDLLITDHHEAQEEIPMALAVVDPKRRESTYPFSELSGAGVAYKILCALYEELGESTEELNNDLDLVALGTIADVAPLIDENRVIARYGLERIAKGVKPGIRALLEVSKLAGKPLSSSGISFGLAPRINASGRMSDAEEALRLLLTDSLQEARQLAAKLDKHNQNRRQTEDSILESARVEALRQVKESNPRILVCYNSRWHEGIVGIVAARLVDEFYRPAILLVDKDDRLKGSGRSIRGFHLHDALLAVRKHLVAFGGHEAAAGLVMEKSELDSFRLEINRYACNFPNDLFLPQVYYESEVDLAELDEQTVTCLEKFRPFGVGNPSPCFSAFGLEVVGVPRVVGRDHLKFTVRKDDKVFPVIAYGRSDLILKLEPGRKDALDMIFRIDENEYLGKKNIQFVLRDIKFRYETEASDE